MSTGFIVLGHGSKVEETKEILEEIAATLRSRLQSEFVRYAALQFNEPDLPEVIESLADEGVTELIIMPLFMVDGNHIRQDIPEIIRDEEVKYPLLKIKVAEHIGPDVRIADILIERANELLAGGFDADGNGMKIGDPAKIERESFRIIEAVADLNGFSDMERSVVKRMIHASGDLTLSGVVAMSDGAVEAGVDALRSCCPIITDVRMVAVGISDRRTCIHDNNVLCRIDDKAVEDDARRAGKTRSAMAIRSLSNHADGAVIAIGNAPTALFELLDIAKEGVVRPALVVGAPVGFVGAAESKEALMRAGLNYITVRGTRGGSALAASAINALLMIACNEECK
ncbi:MAG: precorrin-8X methylmutase [Actinobacteria bacterium]|nr:precorrin-8X methylmutase [Actinomycetota bacterium]